MFEPVRALIRSVAVLCTAGLRVVAILLLCSGYAPSPERTSLAAAAPVTFELQVRPRVCITLESDSSCPMLLAVTWSGPVAADVCLKLEDSDSMLQCWQQQRAGEFELELVRSSNAVVQLLDSASNTILDEAEVTIVSRDLRESRRRRRHVWSII